MWDRSHSPGVREARNGDAPGTIVADRGGRCERPIDHPDAAGPMRKRYLHQSMPRTAEASSTASNTISASQMGRLAVIRKFLLISSGTDRAGQCLRYASLTLARLVAHPPGSWPDKEGDLFGSSAGSSQAVFHGPSTKIRPGRTPTPPQPPITRATPAHESRCPHDK